MLPRTVTLDGLTYSFPELPDLVLDDPTDLLIEAAERRMLTTARHLTIRLPDHLLLLRSSEGPPEVVAVSNARFYAGAAPHALATADQGIYAADEPVPADITSYVRQKRVRRGVPPTGEPLPDTGRLALEAELRVPLGGVLVWLEATAWGDGWRTLEDWGVVIGVPHQVHVVHRPAWLVGDGESA